MPDVSSELKTHLAGAATSLTTCWEIIRRDGRELNFTELDIDVLVDNETEAALIWDEKFETGLGDGWDETYSDSVVVDVGSVLNPEFIPTAIGSPDRWLTESLQIDVEATDSNAYRQDVLVSPILLGKIIMRTETMMVTNGLADTEQAELLTAFESSSGGSILMSMAWRNRSGDLTVRFKAQLGTGNVVVLDWPATGALLTKRAYIFEMEYDLDNGAVRIKIDGKIEIEAIINKLGPLVPTDFAIFRIGKHTGAVTAQTVYYMDNVTYAQDGWPGPLRFRAKAGYRRTAVQSTSDLRVDNLDIQAIFDDDDITDADIRKGLYDFATVRIFAVNFFDLTMGKIRLGTGNLGEVTLRDNDYTAELRRLTDRLQRKVGRTTTEDCDVNLGNEFCKFPLDPLEWAATTAYIAATQDAGVAGIVKPIVGGANRHFRATVGGISDASEPSWNTTIGGTTSDGTVTWTTFMASTVNGIISTVINDRSFTDTTRLTSAEEPDEHYDFGVILWITGNNAGQRVEVKTWINSTQTVVLNQLTAFPIEVGDTYEMQVGCNKIDEPACNTKFGNIRNFRGFNTVPGTDTMLKTPNAQ